MAASRPLQLGAGGDGQPVEPIDLGRDGRQRQLGQRPQVGLGVDVELLGEVGAGRGQPLADPDQLAVEVVDHHLGAEHVLLAGAARSCTARLAIATKSAASLRFSARIASARSLK